MAMVTACYDTNAKTLKVDKDGQDVPNVTHVRFGKDYGDSTKHYAEIHQEEKDKEHDTTTHTMTRANEAGELVAETKTQLTTAEKVKAFNDDVAAFFKRPVQEKPATKGKK